MKHLGARFLKIGARSCLLPGLLLALHPGSAGAWGLSSHAIITRQAIARTPEPLRGFLRSRNDLLVDYALEPDTVLKKKLGRREVVRHFLNLELLARSPYTNIPSDTVAARSRYGARRLRRAGELPWHTAHVYRQLVDAMRKQDETGILHQAGYLAHYVSDAFSPLHATKNYDGRLTGNDGIHGMYERAMVAHRAKYFRDPGPRETVTEQEIPDVSARILEILRKGHARVPEILKADRRARLRGEPGSDAYLDALFDKVGSSARDRMRASAREIALLWTSAWMDAGRPPLGPRKRVGGCGW